MVKIRNIILQHLTGEYFAGTCSNNSEPQRLITKSTATSPGLVLPAYAAAREGAQS